MKTKFYAILCNMGKGWFVLDDCEYTEMEANKQLRSYRCIHPDFKFRKKCVRKAITQLLTIKSHKHDT